MRRLMIFVTITALLSVAAVSAASAGGWAVVTLDAMPMGVVVDTPVTVGMMIRQHGITPMDSPYVKVRGFQQTGDSFEVGAKNEGGGHYTTDLTFSKPGTWQWQVASGLYPEWQPMPEIQVANSADDEVLLAKAITADATPSSNLEAMAPSMLLLGAGVLGFVVCAGGLVYWFRAHRD